MILRYAPIINWDRTDRERVEAMIEVRVTPAARSGLRRDSGAASTALTRSQSVYLMSGGLRPAACMVEAHTLKELALLRLRPS